MVRDKNCSLNWKTSVENILKTILRGGLRGGYLYNNCMCGISSSQPKQCDNTSRFGTVQLMRFHKCHLSLYIKISFFIELFHTVNMLK